MRTATVLRGVLVLLAIALTAVVTSYVASERNPAAAAPDAGSAKAPGAGEAGDWILVSSTLREGEGLLYVFNTKSETLLAYAYHRGRKGANARQFTGDLEFLAGRCCKWDRLCSTAGSCNASSESRPRSQADMEAAWLKVQKVIK